MATLTGTSGDDTLTGTSSADTLVGSGGNDIYDGAGGSDTLDLRGTSTATIIDFTDGTISGGFTGSITNIERVLAGNGNDHLIGGAGAQNLSGRAGADTLEGGAGNDWLWGGGDADHYVFRETGTANADQVGDFISGADKIVLDGSVMSALGAEGNFAAGDARFVVNTSGLAQDASDRVIYQTDTRQIWYDPDGDGGAARQLIATLQSGATLTATDVVVQGAGTPPPGGATEGDDTLTGTSGADTINGLGGNDSIAGLAGDDSLSGDDGNDTMDGGVGSDTVSGGLGDDVVILNGLNDYGHDAIDGGAGFDWLLMVAGTSPVTIDMRAGTVTGGGPGGSGSATFVDIELVSGTDQNDLLIGNDEGERHNMQGQSGDDTLLGGSAPEFLDAQAGNDVLNGGAGNDTLSGGAGADSLVFDHTGVANFDIVPGFVSGTDKIHLDASVMTALGASGNFATDDPRFFASDSATSPHDADDRVIYNAPNGNLWYTDGVNPSQLLATFTPGTTLVASDFFVDNGSSGGNQHLVGTPGDDNLAGDTGNDTIEGLGGLDTLNGAGGNDLLAGGSGWDTLTGGAGQDTFAFVEFGSGMNDAITDFVSGTDTLQLDAEAFTAIGASGRFTAGDGRFFAAPGATGGHDADDRLVYDTTSGILYYDANGNGSGGQARVAILQGAPSLAATDIVVVNGASSGAINGTSGNDTLVGTPGNDTINGLGGNDSISGLAGDDSLSGGDGNDTLDGGAGADTFDGGLGDDTYLFNPGDGVGVVTDVGGVDTTIVVEDDAITIWNLHPGLENLILHSSRAFFIVGEGNELDNVLRNEGNGASEGYLDGHEGNDTLVGGPFFLFTSNSGNYGNDFVDGAGEHGTLIAGARSAATVDFRNGTVVGGGFDGGGTVDFVDITSAGGGQFDDTFIAGDAGISVRGDAGNDTFIGGAGDDHFQDDVPVVYDGVDISGVSAGDDSLSGGGGDDLFRINRGNDTVDGGAGNDTISITIGSWFAGDGYTFNDVIDGGTGIDTLGIVPLSEVNVNLSTGVMTGGGDQGTGSATLLGIENFSGGSGNIVGSAADNVLTGGGTLNGAGGNDTLTGFNGADHFVFDQAPGSVNADHVTNFASGTDEIHLDAAVMTALGSGGQFADDDARFFAAAGATAGHDADDRVVYNTSTGQLFYDADGNGAGASQIIATLDGPAALAATDVFVDNGSEPPPPPPGNTVNGTAGDDSLVGTAGDDTINGFGGNDTLHGGHGSDRLDGGTGDDLITGGDSTVESPDGNDVLIGGDGNDTLDATGSVSSRYDGGVDTLDGGAGNDVFIVDGQDVLTDSGGIDTVMATLGWTLGAGFENLSLAFSETESTLSYIGNDADNVIDAAHGYNFVIDGAGGNDLIQGGSGGHHETMRGGLGDDTIIGSVDPILSVLDGGDGNDSLTAHGSQNTTMLGGAGNDTLNGGREHFDSITGGTGADHFVFDDTLDPPGFGPYGTITDFETGIDQIHFDASVMNALGRTGSFSAGDSRFFASADATGGHDADDRVVYDTSTGDLYYDADGSGSQAAVQIAVVRTGGAPASLSATDIVVDNGSEPPPPPPGNTVNGTSGSDTLSGTSGNDTLNGLGGNDTLVGSGGTDFYDGGSGSDTLDLRATSTATAVSFAAGTISGGFSGTFANIERVLAGNGADSLTGGSGAQNLSGRAGNDTVEGGAGNDWLWGGGSEVDTFVFREAGSSNADDVGDFTGGVDRIALDNATLAALGADGAFAGGDARFFAASGASAGHDGDDRIIYNTSTGQLYYDDDGSGAHAAQLIATLHGAPTLAAGEITVI